MKKVCVPLVLSMLLSASALAQSENESNSKESSFSNYEPASWTRAPYCSGCKKRHYVGCTPSTPTTPPASVPFDGGLSVLLIAGAAYGANKVRRKKSPTIKKAD